MSGFRIMIFGVLLAFAAGLGAVVHGASGQHGEPGGSVALAYDTDRQQAAVRTAVGVADSPVIATITSTATGQIQLNGKPNMSVDAVFTAASQTCVIQVLWVYRNEDSPTGTVKSVRWSAPVTLTGTTKPGFGDTGNATAPGWVFDTGGARFAYLVVTTAAASGTSSYWVGTF